MSDDPTLRLAFSCDTLSFDTVFTQQGSVTAQLMVYNRNASALVIDRVWQEKGNVFSINIDGEADLDRLTNIQINGGDSLFVFIRVSDFGETTENTPVLIEDLLHFHLATGTTQDVLLEAYAQDAGDPYEPTDENHTADTGHNVIRVGEALAEALEKHLEEERQRTKAKHLAEKKDFSRLKDLAKDAFREGGSSYLRNCSNHLSKEVYAEMGLGDIHPSYEQTPPEGAILMQCRYCIRHQSGLCRKDSRPLYLKNGNNILILEFDCSRCEMLVKAPAGS